MMTVWPADTPTGGISFLGADLGSVGALVGPKGFVGASVRSQVMGNWIKKKKIWMFGVNKSKEKATLTYNVLSLSPFIESSAKAFRKD